MALEVMFSRFWLWLKVEDCYRWEAVPVSRSHLARGSERLAILTPDGADFDSHTRLSPPFSAPPPYLPQFQVASARLAVFIGLGCDNSTKVEPSPLIESLLVAVPGLPKLLFPMLGFAECWLIFGLTVPLLATLCIYR